MPWWGWLLVGCLVGGLVVFFLDCYWIGMRHRS